MKRILSILVVISLCIACIPCFDVGNSKVYATDDMQVYYHLDIGVWPIPHNEKGWTFGYKYGDTRSKEFNITFGRDIEVISAHPYMEENDVFQFDSPYCTSNVPVLDDEGHKIMGQSPSFKDYEEIYKESKATVLPTNLSNITVSNVDSKTVKMAYSIRLESEEEYDVAKRAKDHLSDLTATKEVITEITKQEYVLTGSDREKKEQLLKEYRAEYERIRSSWTSVSRTPERLTALEKLIRETEALLAEKKTVSQVISEYEYEETDLTAKFQAFKNEIYSYWGSKEALAVYDATLANSLENVWDNVLANSELKFDLIFVPIVIEYKAAGRTCEKCGQCILDPDAPDTICSEASCEKFGTRDCGCYEEQITYSSCQREISWNEYDPHTWYCGGCRSDSEGNVYCPGHRCNHRYTYTTTLTSSGSLTPDQPNGKVRGLDAFKSGYGFAVTMTNTINTRQTGNGGSCGSNRTKANVQKPQYPNTAEIRTNWTVTNKDKRTTQSKTVALKNNGNGAFVTAANPVSNYNKALIYTDVAIKGTRETPVKHTVTLYCYGGGVNGTAFCNTVNLDFYINGNMYEDDFTVDGWRN